MSVVVRGMKMPTSCSECAFCGYYGKGDHLCDITGKDVVYELSLENRLDDCPLVELPEGHGRLIDSSAIGLTDFEIVMCDGNYKEALTMLLKKIERAPTVIEAEEANV